MRADLDDRLLAVRIWSPETLRDEIVASRREMDTIQAELASVRRELVEHMDRIVVLEQQEASLEREYGRAWRRCSNLRPGGDAA